MKRLLEKIGTTEIRNILAVISVVGAFILLYLMIVKPIPVENRDTLNIAIGFVFGGLIGGISGFFFGASKTDKNESK